MPRIPSSKRRTDPDPPVADTETDHGETLDEALGSLPDSKPTRRKRQSGADERHPQESLSLGDLTRIVERVFKFDFDASYSEVLRFLEPGDDRRLDFGLLQRELDRSTEMATLAHRLYTNAREACEIFAIDRDLILASMRDAARYRLEEDKRNRIRLKPITDADVLGMMQAQDPARWRDLKLKAIRMEATRDHLERVADLARKRIDVLKTLVEKKQ